MMLRREGGMMAPHVLAEATPRGLQAAKGFEATLALRVSAIFVVAGVSALGCLMAIAIGCNEEANNLPHRLLKCLAAGVIGAVGMVHVLPEAASLLEPVTGSFPLAHVVALAGALLVVLINQVFDHVVTRMKQARLPRHGQHQPPQPQPARAAGLGGRGKSGGEAKGEIRPGSPRALVAAATTRLQALADEEEEEEEEEEEKAGGLPPALSLSSSPCATPQGACRGESYRIVYGFRKQPLLVAYVMEVGIVFHSVLIGVGLGVLVGSKAQARSLLVAICFHQFFEGAGLAACLLEARLSRGKMAAMVGLFSATTPAGIALGIAVSSSYDATSLAAALVQGLLNAMAAGILIWLSLVEMVAEEFNRPDVKGRPRLQAAMFATTLAGAAIMSGLAVFE